MANPNFRGRQKGSTKKTSTISDPLLGDYKITFDENSYNVVLIDPQTQKEKVVGYYSQLPFALKRIAKDQVIEKKENYTLKEYITELESTINQLKTLMNYE